jgi:hypothetical protein
MAYTLRHVSREAHYPATEKPLKCGETNRGLGSVKKAAKEAAKRKLAEAMEKYNREIEGEPSELATENS